MAVNNTKIACLLKKMQTTKCPSSPPQQKARYVQSKKWQPLPFICFPFLLRGNYY